MLGVEAWNQWRESNPSIKPDLSGADLSRADLSRADLRKANLFEANLHTANLTMANLSEANLPGANLQVANLSEANLSKANLIGVYLFEANLHGANLSKAHLIEANLSEANLHGANLHGASLMGANLIGTDLSEANLMGANLIGTDLSEANLNNAVLVQASLVETNLKDAGLTGCMVYGISVWNARLDGAKQSNLLITTQDEPATITVDSLEIAQFMYLLLNNAKIRHVIDTITSKVVLILGRFTPERKAVLDAIREELRKRDYLPVLFDFEKPSHRDLTETVRTVAHMARFVIADITDAKSIPRELMAIVPNLPSVPVQPLLLASQNAYGMFEHFRRYPWVLEPVLYENQQALLVDLESKVIAPAEAKANQQRKNNG